jgi:hypothetical protein
MSGVTISLGGVVLQDFEVPEKIAISGGQWVIVHNLIGGGRVVDALGADGGEIEFGGAFSGEDAVIRAQLLDAATALGAELPLYWNSFFYMVIIDKFKVNFEKPWWIPFSLSCAVVLDPAAVVAGLVNAVGNLIAGDVSSALALAPQAGLSLGLSGAPSLSGLANAQSVTSIAFGSANSSLTAQSTSLAAATDPVAAGASIAGLVSTSGQLAALSNISGHLQRASTNMANELV